MSHRWDTTRLDVPLRPICTHAAKGLRGGGGGRFVPVRLCIPGEDELWRALLRPEHGAGQSENLRLVGSLDQLP